MCHLFLESYKFGHRMLSHYILQYFFPCLKCIWGNKTKKKKKKNYPI